MTQTAILPALCLVISLLARAQDSSKTLAMENAWNKAELHNDAAAVRLLLADDFVMTVAEGAIFNKAQILASIRSKSYQPDVLESSGMAVHSWEYGRRDRGLSREGCGQGQALGTSWALHRYLGLLRGKMAVRCQPFQREAEIATRRNLTWLRRLVR